LLAIRLLTHQQYRGFVAMQTMYDPRGSGAAPNDLLVRRGMSWESAQRLAKQAQSAEQAGSAINGVLLGHGVSLTSPQANQKLAHDPSDAVQATRRAFEEAGFAVRYTPTRRDTDHHTVQLPKPVTEEIATRFNTVLGRQ
jgi:hypothetical protein